MKPNNETVVRHVTTDDSGMFSDEYVPNAEGGWSVKAAWPGDEYYLGSSSKTIAFTVNANYDPAMLLLIVLLLALGIFTWLWVTARIRSIPPQKIHILPAKQNAAPAQQQTNHEDKQNEDKQNQKHHVIRDALASGYRILRSKIVLHPNHG
jgi:hypothetical protein